MRGLGRAAGLLSAGLLALGLGLLLASLVLRQTGTGSLWLGEAWGWAIAAALVLAIPAAGARDAHVRVDLLRERLSNRARARIERLGGLVLLALMALALTGLAPALLRSVLSGEGSPQIGGLPHYWLLRAAPMLACLVLAVQALATLLAPDAAKAGNPAGGPST